MSAAAPKSDAMGARYGALLKALAPELTGFALAGAGLQLRTAWGTAPHEFQRLAQRHGWNVVPEDRTASFEDGFDDTHRLLALPLVSDSGRALGAVALVWPIVPALDATALRTRVEPAIECLRQEISAADASARAMELQLAQVATQLQAGPQDVEPLEGLLATSLRRSASQAAMLLVPSRGIVASAQVGETLAPEVAREFAGLRSRLLGLAGKLRRPLSLQGPSSKADKSSACRVLVIPTRCCGGRVEALVAYLNPLTAPAYGAQQLIVLQSAVATMSRVVEADLDLQTGLLNRTGLEQLLGLHKAGVGSLVLFDIDRHHALNEVHGFAMGDTVILRIAELLVPPLVPAEAYVARLNGGTFAVLVPDLELNAATELATAIQKAVGAMDLRSGADRVAVSISCGVAEIRNLADPLPKSLVPAEVVLRLAKERGRSRVEVHVSENSTIIRRHDEVFAASDLREAIRTGQLVLYAQKIVNVHDTKRTTGYELLVRMRDPETGNVRSPAEFIAAAQRYQLLPAVDRYVADAAFQILSRHRALLTQVDVTVSINVSGQSIGDPEFVDFFIERLRHSRVPPGRIIIEITEQAAVVNLARATETMRKLREAGCGIAIDDFGTGANSLAYLRSMPVTRIKIDGSFVKDILTNSRSENAVRGIVQLARDFNLDCVAEYVETQEILDRVRQLGVQKGQGYLFDKPAPLEDAIVSMENDRRAEMSELLDL